MREIKFRGRSIDGWLYGETIWFNEFPTLNNRQIYMPNPDDENCDELNVETWSIVFDVCQFTGLKDSNGNEIYEGDIVKIEDYFGGDIIGRVIYDETTAGYVFHKGNERNYFQMTLDLEGYVHYVIGNIYENPELLEETMKTH